MTTLFWRQALKKVTGGGSKRLRRVGFTVALLLLVFWLVPGCPAVPGDPELKKDIKALKAEMAAMKEKLGQMEANQKEVLELVKKLQQPQVAAPGAPQPPTTTAVPGVPAPAPATAQPAPEAPAPLTVTELFKNKDQLLGTRVVVRGVPGPVLMHKKTLFLSGPGGMVEVIYGNLQDKKQVERLTSQTIDAPLTVSGFLSAAPGQTKNAVRLLIMADTVEF